MFSGSITFPYQTYRSHSNIFQENICLCPVSFFRGSVASTLLPPPSLLLAPQPQLPLWPSPSPVLPNCHTFPQFLLCLVVNSSLELHPTLVYVPSLCIHSCSNSRSLTSLKGPGMWSSRVTYSLETASSIFPWWWWPKCLARPQAAQFLALSF